MWQAWVSEFHFSERPANGANEIGPSAARMAYHLLENMLDDLDKRHPGVRDEVRQAFGSPRMPESGTITQGVLVPDPVETEVSTAEVPAAPNTAADPVPVLHADGWSDVGTTASFEVVEERVDMEDL